MLKVGELLREIVTIMADFGQTVVDTLFAALSPLMPTVDLTTNGDIKSIVEGIDYFFPLNETIALFTTYLTLWGLVLAYRVAQIMDTINKRNIKEANVVKRNRGIARSWQNVCCSEQDSLGLCDQDETKDCHESTDKHGKIPGVLLAIASNAR